MDPRDRFSAGADLYERYRPGYPDALTAWLVATTGHGPGARLVDLGCGTGISSRFFAGHGYQVTGVEPNTEMRDRAVSAGGGPTYVAGQAEHTGLPDGCAELVVAAQAFHWFDGPAAIAEIDRLLVPGGWGCAFWNLRDPGPLDDEYEALLLRYCAEYPSVKERSGGLDAALVGRPRTDVSLHGDYHESWERFFGRVSSGSYVVHGVADRPAFDAALRELFDRRAEGGVLTVPMRTEATAWPRHVS